MACGKVGTTNPALQIREVGSCLATVTQLVSRESEFKFSADPKDPVVPSWPPAFSKLCLPLPPEQL